MKNLKITSDNGYLNLTDLPSNSIFNKVVTGCGGTTVALFSSDNYVISVPTTELITNKTGLNEAGVATITSPDGKQLQVFGLFGIFSYQVKKELKEYLSGSGLKKIICTYDKLSRLAEYLNPADYKLLVDEYHILLKAYSYRRTAIDGVLESYKAYKSYCFMSATPISPEFKPSALEGVEEVNAVWDDTDTLKVKLDRTNKPYLKAAHYIEAYKRDGYITIDGNKSYEAFFFINSVTDIANILQYCNLTKDEVKIVCADNEQNRAKLAGYTISNSRSENKPFTFITSKSFEGADYFSDSGVCFVVSNSSNTNTLLDISTDIYQIAGRIRTATNPFRNIIIHIFNTTGKRDLSLDITYPQMVQKVEDDMEGAKELINLVNSSDKAKKAAEKILNRDYIMIDKDGKYFVNDMLIKLDLFTFKLEQSIYKDGISIMKNYNQNGIITTAPEYDRLAGNISTTAKKITFKEAFLRYVELSKNLFTLDDSEVKQLIAAQPLVVEAYDRLGADRVKSLRYVKKSIEAALITVDDDKSNENKIAKLLQNRISIGFTATADIQLALAESYTAVGVDRKAKASDIEKYFNCKSTTKRIDGKVKRGYEIYSSKIVFK